MTKLFLIGVVIALCYGVGSVKSARLKSRYKNLCSIKTALCDMKSRIGFFGFDISRSLLASGRKKSAEILFKRAAESVCEKGISKAWSDAVEVCGGELCLCEEDKTALLQLSGRLGMTDCDGQMKNIDGVIALLDINIADAKYNMDRYCPLYLGGGVLVGAFLGLMII